MEKHIEKVISNSKLAGYTPEQIAPMFKEAINLKNVYLPQRFWDVLNKTK